MKNTLSDLNNYLFEQIERLQNDEMSENEFETELKRAKMVSEVAKVIVSNAEVALSAVKHMNEYGYGDRTGGRELAPVPAMLIGSGKQASE